MPHAPRPFPSRPPSPPSPGAATGADPRRPPRRRELLAVGVAGVTALTLLTGCQSERERGPDAAADGERSAVAKRLRRRAARDSDVLLTAYQATVRAHPELTDRLRPLRTEVARHARALRDGGPDRGFSGQRTDGEARRADRAATTPPPVPTEPRDALRALAKAERRTADARLAALADAPPELARLLASIAAAGAAHAYLLTADA